MASSFAFNDNLRRHTQGYPGAPQRGGPVHRRGPPRHGKAVHVEQVEPMLKAPETKRLILNMTFKDMPAF